MTSCNVLRAEVPSDQTLFGLLTETTTTDIDMDEYHIVSDNTTLLTTGIASCRGIALVAVKDDVVVRKGMAHMCLSAPADFVKEFMEDGDFDRVHVSIVGAFAETVEDADEYMDELDACLTAADATMLFVWSASCELGVATLDDDDVMFDDDNGDFADMLLDAAGRLWIRRGVGNV